MIGTNFENIIKVAPYRNGVTFYVYFCGDRIFPGHMSRDGL
jgi:hypothetical protein